MKMTIFSFINKNYEKKLVLNVELDVLSPNTRFLEDKGSKLVNSIPAELRKRIVTKPDYLEEAHEKYELFDIANYKQHGGDYGGSFHVIRHTESEASRDQMILYYLLLMPTEEENLTWMNRITKKLKQL